MSTLLLGKVIVVTGGSGMIGRTFIEAILEHGGIPIIADIDIERALLLKEKLNLKYNTDSVEAVELDITSKESLENSIQFLHATYGRIDALVNNAYPKTSAYGKHFFDIEYDEFNEMIGRHLGGYVITTQQYAKYFYEQGYGNIINMSSIYGVVPPKFEIYEGTKMTTPIEYTTIKSGLLLITKYLAKYFSSKNIRVNAISAGGILDQQPESFLTAYRANCISKGMLDAPDLVGALIFLISDMSRYINGQNIIVDDGFTL